MSDAKPHIPVMMGEVLESLNPQDGDIIIDGTFGAGGYSTAILNHANCHVIGFDRDKTAHDAACDLLNDYNPRLKLVLDQFGNVANHVEPQSIDGFVLDIGVSSMQLDRAERGFSFMRDGPLDMRMGEGETAAELIERLSEEDLANIIYKYGEERKSRLIAKVIKESLPIQTTLELADIIAKTIPKKRGDKIHPATRTFQALRIAVNDELGELERALDASLRILKSGGRLVVVTFHSLEDRIVKSFLKKYAQPRISKNKYATIKEDSSYPFTLIHRKAVQVMDTEAKINPRSRSAKLRSAIRTEVEIPS